MQIATEAADGHLAKKRVRVFRPGIVMALPILIGDPWCAGDLLEVNGAPLRGINGQQIMTPSILAAKHGARFGAARPLLHGVSQESVRLFSHGDIHAYQKVFFVNAFRQRDHRQKRPVIAFFGVRKEKRPPGAV